MKPATHRKGEKKNHLKTITEKKKTKNTKKNPYKKQKKH